MKCIGILMLTVVLAGIAGAQNKTKITVKISIYYKLLKYSMLRVVFQCLIVRFYAQI